MKKKKSYPVEYNGKFWKKSDCDMQFCAIYESNESLNCEGGTYFTEGLWIYPQQKIAHSLIDANLYWLKKAKIEVSYTETEPDYEFASYISVADLKKVFNDGQK